MAASGGTTTGSRIKADRPWSEYASAYSIHSETVEKQGADFDVKFLSRQIDEECIWPSTKYAPDSYGGYADQERGYCISLVSRVDEDGQGSGTRIHIREWWPTRASVIGEFMKSTDAVLQIA